MTALLIEYVRANGEPLRLADLGYQFMEAAGIPLANAQRPLRVEAEAKTSKAGNAYFEYQHAELPLPDGLLTQLRVAGVVVTMKPQHISGAGHPTREGQAVVTVNGMDYDVTVFLTQGKKPYWVKVHAHKAAQKPAPAREQLSGGRIV